MFQQLNPTHFCFYFPYNVDSGVPVLFYRLALAISSNYPEIKLSIIDYADGVMARNLKNIPNIHLEIFTDKKEVNAPKDAIIILQSDVPYYWPKELVLDSSNKLFYWNLHPRNFAPSLLPLPYLRELPFNNFKLYKALTLLYKNTFKNLRGFVKLLLDNNALVFMDGTNRDYTVKYLSYNIPSPVYIPVPVSSSHQVKSAQITWEQNKVLNFCWVGRISDFKVPILIYTALELAKAAEQLNLKIIYHIVGDGPLINEVKSTIKQTEWFKVNYIGSLPHQELQQYLLDHVDVITSMGTSALEGAILKIPTILLDFSYSKIKSDYKFRWLFNASDFDLGQEIGNNSKSTNGDDMQTILRALTADYELLAEKTYNYYLANHSMQSITAQFVSAVKKSTLRWDMIDERYFKKPTLLKFYNLLRGLKA